MKQIPLLFLIIICSFYSVFSCSFGVTGLGEFDKEEYIFIGEVVGYTQEIKSSKLKSSAYGLKIKSKESVYLPKKTKFNYEIFPIDSLSDCSLIGKDLDSLKVEFPIGSDVRVIAKEAKYLPKLSDGNIRLENRPSELNSISIHTESDKESISSENKLFDYKSFKYIIDEDKWIISSLPNFEVRKELLRLKKSKSQSEKSLILKYFLEITLASDWCCQDLNIRLVFKNHSANEKEYNYFWDIYLKERIPNTYRRKKVFEYVESRLKKIGYKAKLIRKTINESRSELEDEENIENENIDIEGEKVLERALQKLNKNTKSPRP